MADTPLEAPQGFDLQKELRRLEEDRHLNLFYSYMARDEEGRPLEDNLTRAFINTVRMLPSNRSEQLLDSLFARAKHRMVSPSDPKPLGGDEAVRLRDIDFGQVDATLQENVPSSRHPWQVEDGRRYMVTISSGDEPKPGSKSDGGSCPDAWLFSKGAPSYCFLIESKCWSDNPIDPGQMCRHWNEWFARSNKDYKSWDELAPTLLDLTWYDVLEAVDSVLPELTGRAGNASKADCEPPGDNEKMVLTHLWEYIGYYGYRLFKGFNVIDPWASSSLQLGSTGRSE